MLSTIIFSAASMPSEGSSQTNTPLPAARPAAFITTASSRDAINVLASSNLSNTRPSAVEIEHERISCLANALSASSFAASLHGPNAFIPAASNASTAPSAKGASGPATIIPIFFSFAKSTSLSISPTPMGTFSPHCAVPGLPGAV